MCRANLLNKIVCVPALIRTDKINNLLYEHTVIFKKYLILSWMWECGIYRRILSVKFYRIFFPIEQSGYDCFYGNLIVETVWCDKRNIWKR